MAIITFKELSLLIRDEFFFLRSSSIFYPKDIVIITECNRYVTWIAESIPNKAYGLYFAPFTYITVDVDDTSGKLTIYEPMDNSIIAALSILHND